MAWGEFTFIRDIAPASLKKLNDMLRYLFGRIQGGINRKSLSVELSDELDVFGDINGPDGAMVDNISTFGDISGKVLKDSGKKLADYPLINSSPEFTGALTANTSIAVRRTANDTFYYFKDATSGVIRASIQQDYSDNAVNITAFDINGSNGKVLKIQQDGILTFDGKPIDVLYDKHAMPYTSFASGAISSVLVSPFPNSSSLNGTLWEIAIRTNSNSLGSSSYRTILLGYLSVISVYENSAVSYKVDIITAHANQGGSPHNITLTSSWNSTGNAYSTINTDVIVVKINGHQIGSNPSSYFKGEIKRLL